MHQIRFPNESPEYRAKRDELLQAEVELRARIEEVAALRRGLPLGGEVADYPFEGADGPVRLSELFGGHSTLIVYSYMYGPNMDQPCPMCSAYADSLNGQLKHINQRASLVLTAQRPYADIAALASEQGWGDITFVSGAGNTYAQDYKGEMPDGSQVPMCNVFVKTDEGIRHFWTSEMFFVPSDFHPRHVDMLWPLWHYFDVTPEGRGEFMPGLQY